MKNYQRANEYVETVVLRVLADNPIDLGPTNSAYVVPVDWENIADDVDLSRSKELLLPYVRITTISNSVAQLELGDSGRREEIAQGNLEVFTAKDSGTATSNEIISILAQGFEADHIENRQNDIIVRTPFKGITQLDVDGWYKQSLVVPLLVHSLIV